MKITQQDFRTTDWSGGTTSELYITPRGATVGEKNFTGRISSATCELDSSTFTPYDGFTRFITPLDGNLKLLVNGEAMELKPFEVLKFSGADDVTSYSQVRDFNYIVKDGEPFEMVAKDVDGELMVEEKALIFFYTPFTVNGEAFEGMSAFIGDHVKVEGQGKILICTLA
ncbi:HutD family protein [Peptoniphilus equinus]|uniref:HutD family protein n=1 Tax=Peptoniphilus equinus TaxID=3016343 RepID=A0ABY7QTL5_9FIRM|nr:HutD family protein [Peptoniphilus equinus]WBW49696.1 HutD family protein [Peptoniphilus equinus]